MSEVGNEGIAAAQLNGVLTKGSATDGISGGGAIASNKVNTRAQAWIDHTDRDRGRRGPRASPSTRRTRPRSSRTRRSSSRRSSPTPRQGIAAYIDQILPLDYDYTTRSGSRTLRAGDQVRVGTGYDTTKGDVGSIYRYLGAGATLDLGTLSYKTDTVNWKKLGTGTTAEELYPGIGNLTKSDARAIGVLVVLNDLRASAEAWVDRTDLRAATIAIGASEAAQLLAEVTSTVEASGGSFYGTGTVLAVNGILATNVVLSKAAATADHSVLDGAVTVSATNAAAIDATVLAATKTGDTGVSVVLAFNTLGWKSQNFVFNAVDALLGDPLISGAFKRRAAGRGDGDRAQLDGARHEPGDPRRQRRAAERDDLQRRGLGRVRAVQRDRQGDRRPAGLQQGLQRRDRAPGELDREPAHRRADRHRRRRRRRLRQRADRQLVDHHATTAAPRCSGRRSTRSPAPTTAPRRACRTIKLHQRVKAGRRQGLRVHGRRRRPRPLRRGAVRGPRAVEAGARRDADPAGPERDDVGLDGDRRAGGLQRPAQRRRGEDHRLDR